MKKSKTKRKQKQKPWEALGISQRTYYRRKEAGTLEASVDVAALLKPAPRYDQKKPLDFDRARFLQDQLKETNKAATEVIYGDNPTHKLTTINPLSHGSSDRSRGGTITLDFVEPSKTGIAEMAADLEFVHDQHMAEIANEHGDFIAKVDGTAESAALDDALRDAADTALVEQFLWEVGTHRKQFGPLPSMVPLSSRMIEALYSVLKAKGEPV